MTIHPLIRFPILTFLLLTSAGSTVSRAEEVRPPQASLTLPGSESLSPMKLRWVAGWVLARVRINRAEVGWFKIAGWERSCIDPASILQWPAASK